MQSKSQNQDHICNCTDVHFAKENPERKTKGGYQQVCKNQRQTEKHFKKQYLATPLKKQVDVNEICNAVDFFIKNSSITGQVLAIDSGQNLNWQTPDVIGKE